MSIEDQKYTLEECEGDLKVELIVHTEETDPSLPYEFISFTTKEGLNIIMARYEFEHAALKLNRIKLKHLYTVNT